MSEKILFIDTETGGLEPSKHSLLSLALVLWEDFNIVDSKEILINDGILSTTAKALEVNGIDINNHRIQGLSPANTITELNDFISRHFSDNELITLGGHNITFDVNFLKYFLIHNGYKYSKRFSHRTVDTSTVLYYLFLSGKIDQKAVSSQEAFDLFNISVNGRHTALGDAVATAQLFTALLDKISQCAD